MWILRGEDVQSERNGDVSGIWTLLVLMKSCFILQDNQDVHTYFHACCKQSNLSQQYLLSFSSTLAGGRQQSLLLQLFLTQLTIKKQESSGPRKQDYLFTIASCLKEINQAGFCKNYQFLCHPDTCMYKLK